MKKKAPPEPRVPISTTMFGLATVHNSADPAFKQVAVVFPNNPTRWFRSYRMAQNAADKFNNRKVKR